MVIAEKEIETNIEQTEQDEQQSDWIMLEKQEIPWTVENFGDLWEGAITPLGAVSDETAEFELRVDKAFTVGATGQKRNGKSLFLTRAGAVAMVMGLPVWSNFPIEFNYRKGDTSRHCISNPLDWNALFTLAKELEYGVVIISEIQQWLDNRTSGRLNNRLFSYILRQIGKRHLSLWYDCFSLDTIDRRLPGETDVEVYCEDLRKTYWGKTKGTYLEEGEYIRLECYARTNAWLGFTTIATGVKPEYTLYGKPYWHCYDSWYLHDPFEAMAGIELDLEKRKITNKKEPPPLKEDSLRNVVEGLLNDDQTIIPSLDLWKSAGIDVNDTNKYSQIIKGMGLVKRRRPSGYIYDLSNYKEAST